MNMMPQCQSLGRGGSSHSWRCGELSCTGTPCQNEENAVWSVGVSKPLATGAKRRLQRVPLPPLDKPVSAPSTPVGDGCTMSMKNGLRHAASTPDMRQDALTHAGPSQSVVRGCSSNSSGRGERSGTGTASQSDENVVWSVGVSKSLATEAKQRLQRLPLPPLDKPVSAPSTPVGDGCPMSMKNGLRHVASTPDMRQSALTHTGPNAKAAKRHREIMEQLEKVDLGYVKLRFITAEAKKLHQAQGTESRHSLQKTFEDVHCAVKKAGPAYHLIAGFDTAREGSTTDLPTQKHSFGTSRGQPRRMQCQLAKILALRTFKEMSSCREEFRETCRSLDICLPAQEDDVVVQRVQGPKSGDSNDGEGERIAFSSQSTADDGDATATWLSEESEEGDSNDQLQ